MALGYSGDRAGGLYNSTALGPAIGAYDAALAAFTSWLGQVGRGLRASQPPAQSEVLVALLAWRAQMGSAVATPTFPYYEDINAHDRNVTHSPGLNASVDAYRPFALDP